MQQTNAKRIQEVYSRTRMAAQPSRYASCLVGLALSISLATLIGMVVGWLEGIFSPLLQAMLIVFPLVALFVAGTLATITLSADVLLLRSAIKKLRYGDWDFLCHVVLERPVRSKEVLSDPAVAFIIGHLLRKLGYQPESQDLIGQAVGQSPSLASINFSSANVLSLADEAALTTGLERISRAKLLLRVWSNPRTRHTVLSVAAILLLIFYAIQFIKIVR